MANGGAAAAGIPLARVAARKGRRAAVVLGSCIAMLGATVAITGVVLWAWWILALGIGMLGVATAVQLLSRFAATDLALPANRARDLSLVVWSITIGAVVGPNLMGPGAVVGSWLGVTPLAGVFVFTFVAQLFAALVNWFGLRPDPLLTARALQAADTVPIASTGGTAPAPRSSKILLIIIIGAAQAVMVGLMAMTPLHLKHHGGSDGLVGFTLSLHIAGMYALSPVFGVAASRLGRIPVIIAGWIILLASLVIAFIAGPNNSLVQVALILLGLGWSAVTVAGAALLTELTSLEERPKWQGRSDTFMSASGALAGVLAGITFALSDFPTLSVFAGAVLVIGVVATFAPALQRAANR